MGISTRQPMVLGAAAASSKPSCEVPVCVTGDWSETGPNFGLGHQKAAKLGLFENGVYLRDCHFDKV